MPNPEKMKQLKVLFFDLYVQLGDQVGDSDAQVESAILLFQILNAGVGALATVPRIEEAAEKLQSVNEKSELLNELQAQLVLREQMLNAHQEDLEAKALSDLRGVESRQEVLRDRSIGLDEREVALQKREAELRKYIAAFHEKVQRSTIIEKRRHETPSQLDGLPPPPVDNAEEPPRPEASARVQSRGAATPLPPEQAPAEVIQLDAARAQVVEPELVIEREPPRPRRKSQRGRLELERMETPTPPGKVWCSGQLFDAAELRRNLAWKLYVDTDLGLHDRFPADFEEYLNHHVPEIPSDFPEAWRDRYALIALVEGGISTPDLAEHMDTTFFAGVNEDVVDAERGKPYSYWIRCQIGELYRDTPPESVHQHMPLDEAPLWLHEGLCVAAQYGDGIFQGAWPYFACTEGGNAYTIFGEQGILCVDEYDGRGRIATRGSLDEVPQAKTLH